MVKRFILGMVAALLWALPALGQLPGGSLVVGSNGTPIQGGTASDCLTVGSGNRLDQAVCGGAAAGITVGTSVITGGTTTRILYDNAGVLGEYTLTGSGTVVAMQTSPSLTTPNINVATGTSLALGGATIGTNALAVTGTALFNSSVSVPSGTTTNTALNFGTANTGFIATSGSVVRFVSAGTAFIQLDNNFVFTVASNASMAWNSTTLGSGAADVILSRRGPANLNLGTTDAAAPVAQTLSVQSVVAGTSNTAGVNTTLTASQGTGTGAGGSWIFQVAPAGSTGTAQNALATALTIDSTKLATFAAGILVSTTGTFGATTVSNSGITIGQSTGAFTTQPGGVFRFSTRGDFTANSDGVWMMADSAGSSFGRLQLGGSTSSYPAIKRSSAAISFRLADDSADTGITASTLTASAMANAATTSAVCYNTGTGVLTYDGTLGTCTVSTITAKDLDAPLSPKEGLATVMAMRPFIYHLKPDRPTYTPGAQMGMIAEYAREIDSRLVAVNPDGSVAGFRYEQYTAALTAAIQELKGKIDRLEAR